MDKQGEKLMKTLGVAVAMLDKMDTLVPILQGLGKKVRFFQESTFPARRGRSVHSYVYRQVMEAEVNHCCEPAVQVRSTRVSYYVLVHRMYHAVCARSSTES